MNPSGQAITEALHTSTLLIYIYIYYIYIYIYIYIYRKEINPLNKA